MMTYLNWHVELGHCTYQVNKLDIFVLFSYKGLELPKQYQSTFDSQYKNLITVINTMHMIQIFNMTIILTLIMDHHLNSQF